MKCHFGTYLSFDHLQPELLLLPSLRLACPALGYDECRRVLRLLQVHICELFQSQRARWSAREFVETLANNRLANVHHTDDVGDGAAEVVRLRSEQQRGTAQAGGTTAGGHPVTFHPLDNACRQRDYLEMGG